mmetsp:Transcript_45026/g.66276  ORF Transcript_45026/g.66276 Transcript_45026/m.66276 type:complete len:84 (+) Transcript_45026:287-538(+)
MASLEAKSEKDPENMTRDIEIDNEARPRRTTRQTSRSARMHYFDLSVISSSVFRKQQGKRNGTKLAEIKLLFTSNQLPSHNSN